MHSALIPPKREKPGARVGEDVGGSVVLTGVTTGIVGMIGVVVDTVVGWMIVITLPGTTLPLLSSSCICMTISEGPTFAGTVPATLITMETSRLPRPN